MRLNIYTSFRLFACRTKGTHLRSIVPVPLLLYGFLIYHLVLLCAMMISDVRPTSVSDEFASGSIESSSYFREWAAVRIDIASCCFPLLATNVAACYPPEHRKLDRACNKTNHEILVTHTSIRHKFWATFCRQQTMLSSTYWRSRQDTISVAERC